MTITSKGILVRSYSAIGVIFLATVSAIVLEYSHMLKIQKWLSVLLIPFLLAPVFLLLFKRDKALTPQILLGFIFLNVIFGGLYAGMFNPDMEVLEEFRNPANDTVVILGVDGHYTQQELNQGTDRTEKPRTYIYKAMALNRQGKNVTLMRLKTQYRPQFYKWIDNTNFEFREQNQRFLLNIRDGSSIKIEQKK